MVDALIQTSILAKVSLDFVGLSLYSSVAGLNHHMLFASPTENSYLFSVGFVNAGDLFFKIHSLMVELLLRLDLQLLTNSCNSHYLFVS